MNTYLKISPKTKVGELLDAWPHLEAVLMRMSPAFEKLKNPVLRKTVARVATLQQIAAIGRLKTEEIVNTLRRETGQAEEEAVLDEQQYISSVPPEWFIPERIKIKYDAAPEINSGGSPMKNVLQHAGTLDKGEIMELQTPFVPAPILDMMKDKGFKIYCTGEQGNIRSYIGR